MSDHFCPEDWIPSQIDREWLAKNCGHVDIEHELEKFRLYEWERPKTDWSSAFRRWCMNITAPETKKYAYVPEWQRLGYDSDQAMQEAFARKWVSKNRSWIMEHGDSAARALAEKYA